MTGPLGAATLTWHELYKVVSSTDCELCDWRTVQCPLKTSAVELRIQVCAYIFNEIQRTAVRMQMPVLF